MNKLKNPYTGNFTIVGNALINDSQLKPQERFLYVYLASKPNDWNFHNSIICNDLGVNEKTLRRWSARLVETGWISKKQALNEDGTFAGNEYELFQEPTAKNVGTVETSVHIKEDTPNQNRLLSPTSKADSLPAGRSSRKPPLNPVFTSTIRVYDMYSRLCSKYPDISPGSIHEKLLGLCQWRMSNPDIPIGIEQHWVFYRFNITKEELTPLHTGIEEERLLLKDIELQWGFLVKAYNEIFKA
jgi:hypothetical protein